MDTIIKIYAHHACQRIKKAA